MPGAALQELWGLVGTAETALTAVSAMVVATALLGMVTMILTTLNERRREMAILRSVGARPRTILGLLMAEAGVLTVAGVALGVVLLYAALLVLQPYVDTTYGLHLPIEAAQAGRAGDARDDRGGRLSRRAVAGAARLSAVAGGRHDGAEHEEGLHHGRETARSGAAGGCWAGRWRWSGRACCTPSRRRWNCNGISWCRRHRPSRRSRSSPAEAPSISASSAAPTTAPRRRRRSPRARWMSTPARTERHAGAGRARASAASACTSAATSCRSTSMRRGSRNSCWCRSSAPASTCRRRRPTRSSTSRSSKGFDVQGTFDPVWVTGTLKVTPTFTGLADAGYSLEAEKVEPRPGG